MILLFPYALVHHLHKSSIGHNVLDIVLANVQTILYDSTFVMERGGRDITPVVILGIRGNVVHPCGAVVLLAQEWGIAAFSPRQSLERNV